MPVFEFKCEKCDTRFEILVKSSAAENSVTCPACRAEKPKKLFSSFSAKTSSPDYKYDGCADGSCGMNPAPGCAAGMCGLN